MTYADSSFLVSAYASDANTAQALEHIEEHEPRLPLAFLHWPEVAGSFWKNHPAPEQRWDLLQADASGGKKLFVLELDAERVARRAAGLMKAHGRRWAKLRSLDVMHVAAAVEAGATNFLSFDTNSFQRVLAHTQKLKVWPALTPEESKRL